ncbi:MAG: hypothetical protein ABJG68_06215 [Crocinitomicaceae bacterium]
MQEKITNIINEVESYAEVKLEQKSLEAVEKSVNILTGILGWLVVAGILFLVLSLLTVSSIFLLSQFTGSVLQACLIVTGFYVTVLILLLIFKKKLLTKPLKNFLLGEYLKNYSTH